jgi:hypothetical protein
MTIKEVLAKVRKGEALADDEKSILEAYDPDKAANDAAAAARRKAEDERDAAKQEAARLQKLAEDAQKAQDEAKRTQMTEAQKRDSDFKALQDSVAKLTKERDDSLAKAKATERSQTIRDAAKASGISLAPKTVSESLFFQMLEAQLSGVDTADHAKLTAAFEKFKSENPGIIAAPGRGSGVNPGNPSFTKSTKNPFAKDTLNLTAQCELVRDNPAEAQRLAAEAGVPLPVNQ